MKKTVILIHKIPQTTDNLGRTSANFGKDICTVASGVGDSAEVYAVTVISQQLAVISYQNSCDKI
jgi:hypothetical protein